MTPAQYVAEIVVPTVAEFRDQPRCRRRAYIACVVTYHVRDYLEKAGEPKGSVEEVMRFLGAEPFDALQAICNAAKHCGHDRRHPVTFTPGEDYERPPAVVGSAVVGLSRVGDGIGGREILVKGEGLDIYECVRAVLGAYTFHFAHHLGGVDLKKC